MDWILSHLQAVIAIAAAVAYWLNQQRKAGLPEDVEPQQEKSFEDPGLAERTRRIREEIQRKIEQRSRGYTTEQPALMRSEPAEPPPLVREVVARQSDAPPRSRAAATRAENQRAAEILEHQSLLVEQLRQAQEMKMVALRRARFEGEVTDKEEAAKVAVRLALGDDLRDPAALRRAFVLREILGPPVALR
jgi:hypothetical protein